MSESDKAAVLRFGVFELDTESEQLLKNGLAIRLKPQPFKLLKLLVNEAGRVVTREEIRAALWTGDTFVDFEQGVNFAIKQVREALDDDSERSLYIQTVPKRGYRFVAPVEVVTPGENLFSVVPTDPRLHKALWANIAELRLAEEKRGQRQKVIMIAAAAAALVAIAGGLLLLLFR
jgi:DNA-binding winged helix-turn-helix (wHTH) protein